jgi:hypothetical protein
MTAVEGGHGADAKSLRQGNHGGIDRTERQVAISSHELRDPHPVTGDRLCQKVSGRQISKEPDLCLPAKPLLDEIGDLGDHQLRHEQRSRVGLEEPEAGVMVVVVLVDVGVQRT